MKEAYIPAEMIVMTFEDEDIIRTSAALGSNDTPLDDL